MRKRIWVICIAALAICMIAFFIRPKGQQTGPTPEKNDTQTNLTDQRRESIIAKAHSTSNILKDASVRSTNFQPQTIATRSNGADPALLAAWQAPIDFYGKVVDEKSNAVAGATITFRWTESPSDGGNKVATTRSDGYGLFSLHDQRGPSLSVSIQKNGYYTSRKNDGLFNYGPVQGDAFSPDPANPVVFNLRSAGNREPLIKTAYPAGIGQIAQLRHDGTPITISLLNGGTDQLTLEFWRDISNAKASIFDWRCQFSIPGGGIIDTSDEFAFQAPSSGYQSSVTINMPATNQNWQGEIRNQYYVQLPDGNYGRIQVYLLSYNGAFTVESWVNPSGSQNLEPSESSPQGRVVQPGVTEVVPNFK